MGDVNGRGAFTHASYNDFEIVRDNLLRGKGRTVSARIPGYALFIDPPLARAGMTETEIRASGHDARVATSRGRESRANAARHRFMKVLVDRDSHRILAASLLGTEAEEAIQVFLNAMSVGTPYTALIESVPVHPDGERT